MSANLVQLVNDFHSKYPEFVWIDLYVVLMTTVRLVQFLCHPFACNHFLRRTLFSNGLFYVCSAIVTKHCGTFTCEMHKDDYASQRLYWSNIQYCLHQWMHDVRACGQNAMMSKYCWPTNSQLIESHFVTWISF